MRSIDMGALPLTVIVSLTVAIFLLAIRIFVMQRVQTRRQRENRQETERLKSLVAAYRTMAGSFSPAEAGDREQLEAALSDIILFGSLRQVELASACARALTTGVPVDHQELIADLRSTLRDQLGLDAIPETIDIPAAGPAPARMNGEGARGRGGRGGGGMGGGGMGGGGTGVGVGVGLGAGSTVAVGSDPGETPEK
jgi:uncharacterized membrane protein YgcG